MAELTDQEIDIEAVNLLKYIGKKGMYGERPTREKVPFAEMWLQARALEAGLAKDEQIQLLTESLESLAESLESIQKDLSSFVIRLEALEKGGIES